MATATDMTKYVENEDQMPLAQLLNNASIMHRFEMAAGAQAGSVMLGIFNAAAANPDIWKCEPMTVVNAALNAAALHLSISPALGQGCILPYKKYKKGSWEVESLRASFIPMKRGIRELAMRTKQYRVLNSFAVCQGQSWIEDQMTGNGHIEGKRTSDEAIGYGAYLLLFSGYEATEYMSREEILAHVVRYSPSWDKKNKVIYGGSKWDTDFDMMAEGVVLKKLIRNKGVISDKDKAALDTIEAEQDGGDIIDGTVEENAAAMDKVLQKEAEQEADEIERDFPQISPEEAAYNDACQVHTIKGAALGSLTTEQLALVADSKNAEISKAAKIIIEYKAAQNNKAMKELGF